MLERQTVSIARAGELVGVSRRTIYNWIAGGKVQYVRTAGGAVRIFVDTLWREPRGTGEFGEHHPGQAPGPDATGPAIWAADRFRKGA